MKIQQSNRKVNVLISVKKLSRILIFVPLFLSINLSAQKSDLNIQILESGSRKPVSFAYVKISNLKTQKYIFKETDYEGRLTISHSLPVAISVSATGYKTYSDTLHASSSRTQTFYLEPDILYIDQVVVTATRTEKLLKNAPVITRVVSSKDIENKGIDNIENLLSNAVPGIEFQRHGTSKDVDVQGLGGRNILVLVDGERLAGETRGNIDYERINTADIERVEIIKGAASALYGSQAMGAVINIITKKYKQKVYAEVSGQYKTKAERNFKKIDSQDPHAELKKNLDRGNNEHNMLLGLNFKSWHAKTTLSLKNTDAYTLYNNDSLTKHYTNYDTIVYEPLNKEPTGIEGSKQISASQKLRFQPNKNINIEANIHYYNRHKYDFYKEDKKHDYFSALGYGVKLNYSGIKNLNAILAFTADTYNKYDYKERLSRADLNYKDKFFNPKAIISYKLKRQELLLGTEFLKTTLLTDMFVYGKLIDKSNETYTIFLQDEFKYNKKISLVAGLRGQYNTAFRFQLTPKLSFMYSLNAWRFRMNYSAGYRAPELKELYMNWNHLDMFMIEGNENLRPETNNYTSLSAEYSKHNFNASVSVFNNSFKNKIAGVWAENQTIYRFQNISKSNLYGCDASAKIKLGQFIVSGAYSYVNEVKKENEVRLSAISPHSANFNAEYVFTKTNYTLNVNFGARYIGAKNFYTEDELQIGQDTLSAFYPVDYKGYTIYRLAVNQNFFNSVTITAGVENLFNYKPPIVTFNSYTGTGRLFFIKIILKINNLLNIKL